MRFGAWLAGLALLATATAGSAAWRYDKTYSSSSDEYQAMRAAAHGGTKMSWKSLPDWTGLWEHTGGFNFDPQQKGPRATAQLTPEYQKLYDKKLADIAKGIQWDPLSACLPAGYPRWLLEPFLREYILRPEEAWLMTEQNEEIRRVYTDNRGHTPDDEAYPLWEGNSVGFWDGDTLVIHTKDLKAGQYQRNQPDYSDQASTVERMRKIGPDQIEDIVDVYDPASLKAPWHVRHVYRRVKTPGLRINHWSCEENNNTVRTSNGSTDIVLPGEKGYRDPNDLGPAGAPAAPAPRSAMMFKAFSAALCLTALASPALAHHSFAMFDQSKRVSVSGTVKEFQYTNPHSWVVVLAPGADGKQTEWGFESEGPSTLLRAGIKHSSLNPGDKVTATAFPMRDGRPAGSLISITKADGQVLTFRAGPPPAGVAVGTPAEK